ncbi:MAG TPA: M14 metallopeptidase family protein [Gemmatimonadales bacterium]
MTSSDPVAASDRLGRLGRRAMLALTLAITPATFVRAQQVPAPADIIGFVPGTDSLLADWSQIGTYLSALSTASPRVRLDTVGRSTLGKPLLLLTFGTPERLRRLDAIRAGQSLLADPRRMSHAVEDSLVNVQPAVVLINNNIHSTEIASSQMQMTLAHRLATDPRYSTYLDSVIVLMVPSTNPDGLDTVVSWYRDHKGTPYEGGPLPWLYHPYAGHDNNRDWYMLTQVETRAINRVLYQKWFPEVVWDVHQMGNRGARLFVPPFDDPVNPNLDPILIEGTNLVGLAMGGAVLDAGKTGVVHGARFDLWWHGGFRTVPARHNMIGILSEAASARLASPVNQPAESLRQPERGSDYPATWEGGWWRLGDIVEYELLAADGLLRLLATQRASFVRRFATLGRRAVAAGEAGSPWAFLIPPDQADRGAAALLANTIIAGGVEIHRADAPFRADAREYSVGTLIIRMAQPFRAHVKDLLEVQRYPDRRAYPGGPPIPPYDVSGWTLGAQMGVRVDEIAMPFPFRGDMVDTVVVEAGTVHGRGSRLVLRNTSNSESGVVAEVLAAGGRVRVASEAFGSGEARFPVGALVVEGDAAVRNAVERGARVFGFDVWATDARVAGPEVRRLPRIGLYRSWTANIDEGWTRWVFERFAIPYMTLSDSMIRTGDLARFDVLVIPDVEEQDIVSGRSHEEVPDRFSGGLDVSGVREVTEFVARGGTLVTLGASSDFAISALNLPVRNSLQAGESEDRGSRFYAPGSIFGVAISRGSVLASGVGDTVAVFFDDGRAFEVTGPAEPVGSYTADPLLSGYVQNPGRLTGRAALLEVPAGRGRVVLFGFRPQHRGQTHGTFKLLFNAVLLRTEP